MSEPSSRSVPPERTAPGDSMHWMFAAYRLSRERIAKVPLAQCGPVTWNVANGVARTIERLDALEDQGDAFKPILDTWAFRQCRLFAAALGHLNRLHRHAQDFSLTGDLLRRSAQAARITLRKLVANMDSDGFLVEELNVPRRRGDSARSIGEELLELASFGQQSLGCLEQYDRDMAARLLDARLQGELLLTQIGARDAAMVVREVRDEHARACALFLGEWCAVRALLRMQGCDGYEVERLLPTL